MLTLEDICSPRRSELTAAIDSAREIAAVDPSFDFRLIQMATNVWNAPKIDLAVLDRLLELIADIAPPARLFPVFRVALAHSDSHVRSKAALLLGRRVESSEVLSSLIGDGDARVRANTVQALWGRKGAVVQGLFNQALADLHHRVAANAAYGLFLIDPAGHAARLERFVKHPHPRFRRAGAWILRKIGDPANLGQLEPLITDKNAEVRTSAFNALVALRQIAAKQATGDLASPRD